MVLMTPRMIKVLFFELSMVIQWLVPLSQKLSYYSLTLSNSSNILQFFACGNTALIRMSLT
jgi:hypothetical protein